MSLVTTAPAALGFVAAGTKRQPISGAPGFNLNVQGARGFLALMVFVFHVASSGLPSFTALGGTGSPIPVLVCLQYGVEIFFCISGTIVVGALQRARSPGQFLADRAMRILPVLWVTLAVIVPLGIATHQPQYAAWAASDLAWIVPANLVLLPGAFDLPILHMAAWSLSYEMLFYVAAVCVWWAAPRHRLFHRAALLAVAVAVMWQPRAIFFAVGVLVARTDLSRNRVLASIMRRPGLLLGVFFALWYVVTSAGADGGAGSLSAWLNDGRIGLAALGVSAAILAWAGIVAGHGALCRLLRTVPAQWLGSVSYSFYLWHLIVMAILKRLITASGAGAAAGQWSQILLLATALPASLLVAHISATVLERRLTHWLKAVLKKQKAAVVVLVPGSMASA